MDKRVLVPTDFSWNAWNATKYALDLFGHVSCDFYFLNTFTVNNYSIDNLMVPEPGDLAYEVAKKNSEEGFDKFRELLEEHVPNPKHTYHFNSTYNSLVYGIKNSIAKKDIDVVIMGTKGATSAESIIFGTNTIAVMEQVRECPVIAVPEDYVYRPPKEIVFPTDFKTNFKRKELGPLLEIAVLCGAAIRILHIEQKTGLNRLQQGNQDLLKTIFKGVHHSFHTLSQIKVHAGIGSFIESRNSDMVAFVNSRHGFISNMLGKPLVRKMGYHSKIPVLSINQSKQ